MSAAKLSADLLIQMAKARRTIYALDKNLPVSASRIRELVNETTLHTPSSFNSQSNRAVVLLGSEHDKLWDMTTTAWPCSKGPPGTVLFFEDDDVVKSMQAAFPSYADRFPGWATQSAGMQQLLLWTALELEGLGANLQHYNPLIDDKVAAAWGLPKSWKLNAQLVFGGRAAEPGDKDFKPLEDRVKVFGA
ncbi:putative nitroreductase [Metarhizium acridum]|nr:putative nitroreductase [Metarhizium acridum]